MGRRKIQRKFINGIDKIYRKVFSTDILFYPVLSTHKDDLYDEYTTVEYSTPINLVGKVRISNAPGDTLPQEQRYNADFTFSFKSLRDSGVDVENRENHAELRKGKIHYQGVDYIINFINPSTFVADTYLVYVFSCTERK